MQILTHFVIVMLALNGCETVERKCTNGWERFGKKCYKYIADVKPWAEAEQHCLSLGGNLASVHSNQTQYFLKKLARSKTANCSRTWIGAHDATQDSIWLWSDGSKFDFSVWHSSEPSNSGWAEHCVEMNYGAEVLWNDAKCNIQLYFVCQKQASLVNFLSQNTK